MEVKYDKIGSNYNSTRRADPFLTSQLIKHLKPSKNGIYLDIGCGTGNYTNEIQKQGFRLIGIDPSEKMLREARLRNNQVDWRIGSAENIELQDSSIDGVIAFLTIHHWIDLKKGFSELSRVLKPKGRVVIFTSTPEQMKGYWLNHYFPHMLHFSIVQMPSLYNIQEAIRQTELEISDIEKYFIQDDLQDCFLYVGKNNPNRYFDETVRHGISSFSSLAANDELTEGLLKLRNDIDDQTFENFRSHYANELGDYLFISLEKKTGLTK